MTRRLTDGCCSSYVSKQIARPLNSPPSLTPKVGCAPAFGTIGEFIKWFGDDVSPLICAALPLKDKPCHVLTGEGGKYVLKPLSEMAACLPPETPWTAIDTPTLQLLPGTTEFGHKDVSGNVKISADAGNVLSAKSDGLYVSEVPLTVLDSSTVDLTEGTAPDGHTGLTATVKVSAQPGNIMTVKPDGLHVAELPLSVVDSNTVDLTEGTAPDGHAGLTATVKISGDSGNVITAKADGLFVTIPVPSCAQVKVALQEGCITPGTIANLLGYAADGSLVKQIPPVETPLVTTDSSSFDFTTSGTDGHNLTGTVKISSDAGNHVVIRPDGLFVPPVTCDEVKTALGDGCVQPGTIAQLLGYDATGGVVKAPPAVETPLTVTDSGTIDFTTSGAANHTLTGSVKISATAGNTIVANADGIYSPEVTCAVVKTALEGTCVPAGTILNVLGYDATGNLVKSPPGAETPLTVTDTSTIDFTTSGAANHTLTGNVKISATAGNTIVANADGLYSPPVTCANVKAALEGSCVPAGTIASVLAYDAAGLLIKSPPSLQTRLTTTNSATINFVTSGDDFHTLTGTVVISPDAGNRVSAQPNGLFVPPVTCADIKAALEGSCVPAGTIASVLAYDAAGLLIKSPPSLQTPLTTTNSATINFITSGDDFHTLTGTVVISPDAGNRVSAQPNGLFVAPVTCADIKTALQEAACVPDGTIAKNIGFDAAGNIVKAAPSGGTGATVDCATVKTALEGGCVPTDVIAKPIGFNATGGLIQAVPRDLVRIFLQGGGAGIVDDTYTDTLTNHANSANRRVWKWSDWDTARFPPVAPATTSPAQQYVDATFDAATFDFVVGHDAWYRFGTAIFVGLSSTSTTALTSVSVLAGFRIQRPPLGATEIRFGEITQDLGKSDAIRLPAADYFFSGSITMFMPAGSRIRVRFWAAGGTVPSPAQTVSLRASYPTGSYFSMEELPDKSTYPAIG